MLRPPTYQPCSVQGVFRGVKPLGIRSLEAGFPLDAFSGYPFRT